MTRRGAAVTLLVIAEAAISAGLALAPSPAGASSKSSTKAAPMVYVGCKPNPTDPQIEAPLYAQNAGASPRADGWWCELPHATQMPENFVPVRRYVVPIGGTTGTYALFSTQFGTDPLKASTGKVPHITVSAEVNTAVKPPKHLQYPPTRGKSVRLKRHLRANVSVKGKSVVVTWRYPTKGVPKYLRAVTTVIVSASGVPKAEVLDVAKAVYPQ